MIKETGAIVTIVVKDDKELASICDCCGRTLCTFPESKLDDHKHDLTEVSIETPGFKGDMYVCENCLEPLCHFTCFDIIRNGIQYDTLVKRYENWKEHGFAKWCLWAWNEFIAVPFWFLLGIATGVVSGILGYLCVGGGK